MEQFRRRKRLVDLLDALDERILDIKAEFDKHTTAGIEEIDILSCRHALSKLVSRISTPCYVSAVTKLIGDAHSIGFDDFIYLYAYFSMKAEQEPTEDASINEANPESNATTINRDSLPPIPIKFHTLKSTVSNVDLGDINVLRRCRIRHYEAKLKRSSEDSSATRTVSFPPIYPQISAEDTTPELLDPLTVTAQSPRAAKYVALAFWRRVLRIKRFTAVTKFRALDVNSLYESSAEVVVTEQMAIVKRDLSAVMASLHLEAPEDFWVARWVK